MGKWREVQKGLIDDAIGGEKYDIIKKDVIIGKVHGTIYYKDRVKMSRGVLLVHGISDNRYVMSALAERLAEYGFFCLSIDLPSHFLNTNEFTLGELSQTITDGVLLVKKSFGVNKVAVIGHSIGAVGSLFSNAGYNIQIERTLYSTWENMKELIEKESNLILQDKDSNEILRLNQKIDSLYSELKQIILYSLKKGIQENSSVSCYILLAPPLNCKKAIPVMGLLKRLDHKWAKRIFEYLFHKPAIKQIYKEGNLIGYVSENKEDYIYWKFFKNKNISEFLIYFLNMKEPIDFLRLIEDLIKFKQKDDAVSFFEYYQKKYLLAKPKMFIYGTRDLYLRPFMPFGKMRLENFYESCGNSEIHHGVFSHIMMNDPNQQLTSIKLKNDRVTELIIRFLDKHL